VCHNEDGLFLIDQHAAQERVNYERVIDSFEHKEILTTDMLIPVTIELSPSDFLLIKEHMDVLEDMGFVVEEFGLNTYQVNTHPTWLKEGYEEEIIRNIFDEIIVQGSSFDRVRFNNKVLATIACKMSIRANTPLSIEIMQEIVDELLQCKNPYNCAHGRPSIIKFSTYDLERMFKRVMN
jgi:DNA mismatch repair protein MutL